MSHPALDLSVRVPDLVGQPKDGQPVRSSVYMLWGGNAVGTLRVRAQSHDQTDTEKVVLYTFCV